MLIALVGNSAESMLNFRGSLIRCFISNGHEVAAFAPDFSEETRAEIMALGATPHDFCLSRSGLSPMSGLRSINELRSAFARLNPGVVISYFVKPVIYGTIAASLCGIGRRVAILEGLGFGFADRGSSVRSNLLTSFLRRLMKFALSRAHMTFVLNEEDRDVLIEEVGVSRSRVLNVGGIGVELEKFDPAPVREHVTTFAMASRLILEKGVREYVEAARQIRETDNVRFLLLGGVDDNPSGLSAVEIESYLADGIIEWPGRVSDIQSWLKKADVFVLPSYYREGLPRSIQEAMALGRPIITTDHVGCRDTVDHGVNGLLVPPQDIPSLVSAMRYFVDNPGVAQSMGKESRRLAEERFDAARFNARILAAIIE